MPIYSLEPYQGPWAELQVRHLLKRLQFGATFEEMLYYKNLGVSASVKQLLSPPTIPSPPLNVYDATIKDTTGVAAFTTWVKAPYGDGTINAARRNSLKRWWAIRLISTNRTAIEKIILFWHNHFALEADIVDDARWLFDYLDILRKYALGNFKEFVKAITLSPAMLVYLNGNRNTNTAADENYARELQELFVIGKGKDSGYTEDDVKAAAKVLTGYRTARTSLTYLFDPTKHDTTDKKFSTFYKNTLIKGRSGTNGQQELDDLLTMLLATDEAAKFICRRIYTFFLHHDITPEVETQIITPLAKLFRESNYNLLPVFETFFKSAHFNDPYFYGSMIKSPVDIMIGHLRELSYNFPAESATNTLAYDFAADYVNRLAEFQQNLLDPPSVAGWTAYYQIPSFYEQWINTDTYPRRNGVIDSLFMKGVRRSNITMESKWEDIATKFSFPEQPDAYLASWMNHLLQVPLTAAHQAQLKRDILLSGQASDYYWTELWKQAFAPTPVASAKTMVVSRTKTLIQYLVALPEYQLH